MKETTKLNAKYTSRNSKLKNKPEWTLVKIAGKNVTLQFGETLKVIPVDKFEKNWELVPEKEAVEQVVVEQVVEKKPVEKKATKAKKETKPKATTKKETKPKSTVAATTKAPTKTIKAKTLKSKDKGMVIEKQSFEDYKVKKAGKRVKLLLGKRVYQERKIFDRDGKEFFKFDDKEYEVANTEVINYVYKIKYDIEDAGTRVNFCRNGQVVNTRQVSEKDGKRFFRYNKKTYFLAAK